MLARRVAKSTRSLTLGLAMRRNEVEPGGALRVATGLVLLVFGASLVQGVVIELDQVTRHTAPTQGYSIQLDTVTSADQRAFERLPGVHGHLVTATSWRDPESDIWPPRVTVVVATCGQLRKAVANLGRCVDGRPSLLVNSDNPSMDGDVRPGAAFPFHVRNEEGQQRAITVEVPRETVRFHDDSGMPRAHSGDVLLPPKALPRGFRLEGAEIMLISSSAPDVIRTVLDGIGGVEPTVQVMMPGVNVNALEQVRIVKTLLAVGIVLGLVIGVAAYLVAATDRAVERRPQVTALSLIGARPRTLRAVQVAQVVVPLAVGLVLALVAGKAAESSYLVTGGGAIFWDGDGVPLLVASALGVVIVAALGSLPLVGRRIDPELIRRD
jgi:hypothetical protein